MGIVVSLVMVRPLLLEDRHRGPSRRVLDGQQHYVARALWAVRSVDLPGDPRLEPSLVSR